MALLAAVAGGVPNVFRGLCGVVGIGVDGRVDGVADPSLEGALADVGEGSILTAVPTV